MNTYTIKNIGSAYVVTKNERPIIASLTRQPMPFVTEAAAQAFINIQIAADRRHGPRW